MIASYPLKYISAGFGALVWLAGSVVSGRAEAWDSGLYFVLFFPLLLIGAAVTGGYARTGAWRQGLWTGAGHAAMALVTGLFAGNGFGLWPLTIIVFVVLALPLAGAASLGGVIAGRFPRADKGL